MVTADPSHSLGVFPNPRTRLIGREAERATAQALLIDEAVPLLTLTGPGGVGKTRLALAIAQDVTASFADGVVWVDLAPVMDPKLVPGTLAAAIEFVPSPDQPIAAELARHLRPRQTLLLDNCEHLAPAVADLVAGLLAACPAVHILATSRAALKLRDEHQLPVDPLPVPPRDVSSLAAVAGMRRCGCLRSQRHPRALHVRLRLLIFMTSLELPQTSTRRPPRSPCQRETVQVRRRRFFQSWELAKVSSSALNSSKTERAATSTIFRLARLKATVSRRGSIRNLPEASRYSRSLSVAPTRMTVRSPPWNRSTVSTAESVTAPVTGSITVRLGTSSCRSARCARCGTTTPSPSTGSSPYPEGSARSSRMGAMSCLLEAVAHLTLGFVVDHDDEGVLRREDGVDEGIPGWPRLDDVSPLRVVVDSVLGVDLAAEEFRHVGVEAEALREFHHRRREGQEGGEDRLVGAELLERAARFARPVVLDDRRHLAVVPDDHQPAVRGQGQGGHDRFRQVHLGSLVEDQAVGEVMPEEVLGPPLLDQAVYATGGRRHHAPPRRLEGFDGLRCARIPVVVSRQGDDAERHVATGSKAEERDVQQPGIEIGGEDLGVGGGPAAQHLPHLHHVLQEHIRRRMGLAGEEDAEVFTGRHGTLEAGEEGKGGGVALAGAGRALHEEERGAAVAADELAFAGLEPVQGSRGMQRIETGHEPRLGLRSRLGPERQGPFLAGQQGIERVLAAGEQTLNHLGGPRAVDVIRVRVEGVGLAGLQGLLVDGAEGEPRRSATAASRALHHDLGPGFDRAVTVAPHGDAIELGPHAVEHLLGGGGELNLLGNRAAAVDGHAGTDDEPVVRLEGGQSQDLVEVAGDVGAFQAEPKPHPLLGPVRLRLLLPWWSLICLASGCASR